MERLKQIFLYSDEYPLIFTQLYFWVFFAIVLAVYSIVHKKRGLRNFYIFLISLFFYYKTSGFFFFILLFSTLTDYIIGLAIHKTDEPLKKKLLVAASIVVNLFLLVYFKYAHFFTENINQIFGTDLEVINYFAHWANLTTGSHFEVSKILLPVGISFFTFQTISYSLDVYKEKIKPVRNILDFGFYVSFFPQLVAGPIVRASEFIPQLYKEYKLTRYEFGLAIFWILNGLLKKMFISDYIALNFVDRVFENPLSYTGFESLMALYGYSLQVYCDFSGYTDMAIGIALLMGFHLPTNFNSPYKATSVGEFWKRWHMSLSSWLKDYLYIPMGGNRKGSLFSFISLGVILSFIVLISGWLWLAVIFAVIIVIVVILARIFPTFKSGINTNINLMLTMLIGGLWHGASWQFVIWGGLNGLGLVVYKFWRRISPWEGKSNIGVRFWTIFLTFNFITFTRIWFRGESMEVTDGILHQIATNFRLDLVPEIIMSYKYVFAIMLLGFVVHWLPTTLKSWYRTVFINSPIYVKAMIAALAVFIVYQVSSAELQPFIYFQF